MTTFVHGARHIPADLGPEALRTALAEYREKAERFGPESLVGRAAAALAKECEERLQAQDGSHG